MSKELDKKLVNTEIKQTCKKDLIPFRDSAIESIKKTNTEIDWRLSKKI